MNSVSKVGGQLVMGLEGGNECGLAGIHLPSQRRATFSALMLIPAVPWAPALPSITWILQCPQPFLLHSKDSCNHSHLLSIYWCPKNSIISCSLQ